jgi:hypothetical protein
MASLSALSIARRPQKGRHTSAMDRMAFYIDHASTATVKEDGMLYLG